LPGIIPWFVFFLLLAMSLKRDSRALGILIPLFISVIVLHLISIILPEDIRSSMTRFFTALILGQAAFWLVLEHFAGSNRVISFLKCLALMSALGLLFFINWDIPNPREKIPLMIFYGLLIVNLLVSLTLARVLVRRSFSPVRYIVLVSLSNVFFLMVVFFFFGVIMLFFEKDSLFGGFVFQMILMGILIGLLLFATSLPYLVLVFKNGYYREVFYRIFRIHVLPPADTPNRFEDLTKI